MSKQNAAVRLVDTKKLPYGQWLGVRRNGIGSSDAIAAVGLSLQKPAHMAPGAEAPGAMRQSTFFLFRMRSEDELVSSQEHASSASAPGCVKTPDQVGTLATHARFRRFVWRDHLEIERSPSELLTFRAAENHLCVFTQPSPKPNIAVGHCTPTGAGAKILRGD